MTVKEYEVKVFLDHHLGEMECSQEAVLMHIQLSGKLPCVGEPLLALPRQVPEKTKKYAIPYGRVRRIET